MVSDPNWPITRFGVDLTRAVPFAKALVGGVSVEFPSLVQLPAGSDALPEPIIVTTASYNVGVSDIVIAINRVAPTATTINLNALADRQGVPVFIFDISTSVTAHTITVNPNGAEKIMRLSTWQLVSTAAQLIGAEFFPMSSLGNWFVLA